MIWISTTELCTIIMYIFTHLHAYIYVRTYVCIKNFKKGSVHQGYTYVDTSIYYYIYVSTYTRYLRISYIDVRRCQLFTYMYVFQCTIVYWYVCCGLICVEIYSCKYRSIWVTVRYRAVLLAGKRKKRSILTSLFVPEKSGSDGKNIY